MLRVVCMALMNVIPVVTTIFGAAYAVQAAYGIGVQKDVYLWSPALGNILAVFIIPMVGNLADKVGRKPPLIVGAFGAGPLSFADLYAISVHGVPLAIGMSLLMWGRRLPGLRRRRPKLLCRTIPDAYASFGHGDLAECRHDQHGAAASTVRIRGAARLDEHPAHDRGDHLCSDGRRGDRDDERAGNLPNPCG